MSKADDIFKKMCENIIDNGYWSDGQEIRAKWDDGTPAHTIKQFGVVNRYNLAEEFPIMTLRPTNLKACIDEILWIFQKKSNNVNELNSRIWDQWKDENNTIKRGYGYQMKVKHKHPEGEFDQVDKVLYDLKNNPYSRRIITNMYNHADLWDMTLSPCAYSMTYNVTDNKLNAILNQRSQDVTVASAWNVTQYAILVHMFAQVSNLQVGELVHVIADAHIYDKHIPLVEELITRESYPAPKLIINPDITNFYNFTVDDFQLENYQKGKQIKIPVAI